MAFTPYTVNRSMAGISVVVLAAARTAEYCVRVSSGATSTMRQKTLVRQDAPRDLSSGASGP